MRHHIGFCRKHPILTACDGCFRGLIQQSNSGRSERIRTSGPLVPNEVRYQAALHSAAPPDYFSGHTSLRKFL
jgi:hypothetical protein